MRDDQNILLMTDSYKSGHGPCYNPKVTNVYSNFESRGSTGNYEFTVFFGLQPYLKLLEGVVVTTAKIDEAEKFWNGHLGRTDYFDRKLWDYIVEKHGGRLPLRIKAVPEGLRVPLKNVLMSIEVTDRNCRWLTNDIETLLVKVWYPTTIATQSYYIRQNILGYLERTGDPTGIDFKCHDFGYRGVSCEEQAEIGAAAHLLSFMGTDTVAGILHLMKYYKAGMCGFSIPATEHSIMCSFGRENEIQACENFLDKFPTGLIACVSDTYDIYNCCENIWGGVLRDKVMARNGTLVIRPDSGDYLQIVPDILEILYSKFGGSKNGKGFKVLDSHVRVIQGDGMNPLTIDRLYDKLEEKGWSADNLAVGSGGGLLQQVNRDTFKFAFKASAVEIDGKWVDVWKDPVTDPGKQSKRGRLALIRTTEGNYKTIREEDCIFSDNILQTVFENGVVTKEYTLEEVKKNMEIN